MVDLPATLDALLRRAVADALGPELADTDPILRPAGDARFGDYQANLAMSLSKQVKRKPREVADEIVAALKARPEADALLAGVDVAGPGFINLTLAPEALADAAAAMLRDEHLGLAPTREAEHIVVDYSSPNVAKEMHVGHLRSTVIGDALARVLAYRGHRVTRQNHLGDWGTQFGMLIEHLVDVGFEPGQMREREDAAIGDLNALYQQAKAKFDADAACGEGARQGVAALQAGDDETLTLWRDLVEESKKHFNDIYARLNVQLDDGDIRGESFYNDRLADVVQALEQAGLVSESEGARVIFLEGFKDREGKPLPMLVRKGDGGYLYATTDLAAARHRIVELGADRVIYVTDARQSQHFEMLFAALGKAGWATESVRLDHVTFGTILGPDKRPFKTREGGTVRLIDLLDEAEQRAANVIEQKNPELPADDRQRIARVVGIGAVKYADLANDRTRDYVFDWSRMLALDGNTAPYLQNAYVRIRSIFRKGEIDAAGIDADAIRVTAPAERALILHLVGWPAVIEAVAEHLEPHRLCNFLYELAAAYHQFYERCPVLTAPDEATRASRLALSQLVARTLREGLGLLGIDTVEVM
ncbi:MAG: arginine--tRNA ligase [Phycisphaeraceae bacterium]